MWQLLKMLPVDRLTVPSVYALHNGRLTSSRFGEILHRRSTTNPKRLVRDIMGYGGYARGMPPQIRWGRDNESTACKHFLENRKANGEEMVFEPSGLHLLPEKSYLGASSDGKLTNLLDIRYQLHWVLRNKMPIQHRWNNYCQHETPRNCRLVWEQVFFYVKG